MKINLERFESENFDMYFPPRIIDPSVEFKAYIIPSGVPI